MSLKHASFLFDYQAFQLSVAPLATALERGDDTPLRLRVTTIRQQIERPDQWILHGVGGALWDYIPRDDPRYHQARWGHWLLIVLSEFLCPGISLAYDWPKLAHALRYLGWENTDVQRIVAGLPMVWLLKPDAPYQQDMAIHWDQPFWYWIRPAQSTYQGWLPHEDVTHLWQRLHNDHRRLEDLIRTRFPLPAYVTVTKAHLSPELDPEYWYHRIPLVYDQGIAMMQQALDAGVGLFTVVYQEYDDDEKENDAPDEADTGTR